MSGLRDLIDGAVARERAKRQYAFMRHDVAAFGEKPKIIDGHLELVFGPTVGDIHGQINALIATLDAVRGEVVHFMEILRQHPFNRRADGYRIGQVLSHCPTCQAIWFEADEDRPCTHVTTLPGTLGPERRTVASIAYDTGELRLLNLNDHADAVIVKVPPVRH